MQLSEERKNEEQLFRLRGLGNQLTQNQRVAVSGQSQRRTWKRGRCLDNSSSVNVILLIQFLKSEDRQTRLGSVLQAKAESL